MDSGALADLESQVEKVEVLCTPVCASNSGSPSVQCAMCNVQC